MANKIYGRKPSDPSIFNHQETINSKKFELSLMNRVKIY